MKILQLVALAFLAPLASAGVLVVDVNGPGPYTQIQAAVAVASDGDVLLVKPGHYARVEIVDKELAIVGEVGATVTIDGVRVRNLAATRSVLLSGLAATGSVLFGLEASGLLVLDSPGVVFAQGCRFGGSVQSPCARGNGATLQSSGAVVFVNCDLNGSSSSPAGERYYGGYGLTAIDSAVALYDTTVRGGNSGNDCTCGYGYGYTGPGGYGVYTQGTNPPGAFAFASGSDIRGGNGGTATSPCGIGLETGGVGGYGFLANVGSSAFLLGTPTVGGLGGTNDYPPFANAPSGAPWIGNVQFLAPAARVCTTTRLAREQQSVALAFGGQPGDDVRLAVSDRPAFTWRRAWNGVVATKKAGAQLEAQLGVVGPSGSITGSWTAGDLGPSEQARVQYVQPYAIDSSGTRVLGSPRAIVVLDSAY